MANESTDVLMTFIEDGGSGLPAECASVWNNTDSMRTDFTTGRFFEVEDFSLGGGLELVDGSTMDGFPIGSNGHDVINYLKIRDDAGNQGNVGDKHSKDRDGAKSKAARGGRGSRFAAYVQKIDGWEDKLKLDVPEISVSRLMDKCSPILFSSCLQKQAFSKAVIVKRKIVGRLSANRATVPMMGFLRFEFDAPLITSIDWEDGDVIKEKFKFVCRGIKITYKPQNPDGNLGEGVPATWKAESAAETGGSSPKS